MRPRLLPRPMFPALLAAGLLAAGALPAAGANPPPPQAASEGASIVAIVNGDVVSREDVENRRRLFALSTGLPLSPEVLDRLTPQITRQLIDERLRLQEAQRRRILVADTDIARAINEVEARNNMPPGTLRKRLASDGVAYRTLVDQIRVQLAWTRVLRQQLGKQLQITDADIAEQERLLKQQFGQTEFHISEIFIPVENPAQAEEAHKFADTVIQQLRAGAPFPVVAAQFSQSQTALVGGDLGWQQPAQIDPEVLRVLNEMPPGAVSNPIRVPGGFDIVTLQAKRVIGNDMATVLDVRQAFLPFTSRLDPANPTDQQRQALAKAQQLSASAQNCDAVEAAGKAAGSARPPNPGEIRLDTVPPTMRDVLEKLPDGKPSGPLVSEDGILVIMVCSRTQKNMGIPSREELSARLLNERVELVSRQLLRDLQRRAMLDQRS
jgi:peptidyl-prolyl cis-trans isomerase SurA